MIDGRYRLLQMIGEGGMGRVYAAEHVGIGKQVALKILHAVFSNTKEAVERFRGEARLTSKVASAHIVDVTDSGTTSDGRLYFVMEHLDGVELSEAMRDGTLSLERSLHIARQIADALAAAHAQGVIHRDLKPENILLITRENDRDFVKVLDFGIATTIGGEGPKRRLTQPGLAVGTPEYMAPEQALDAKADERSDIYALGTILYEMATGQPAYQGDTFTKVLVDKVNNDPPRPRERRPELPDEVEAIIVKAMARKASERHQSMKELSAEISACSGSLSRPLSLPGIVPPPLEPEPPPPPSLPTGRVSASAMLLEPVDPNGATVAMTVDQTRPPRRGGIIPLLLVLGMALGGAVALYLLVLRPSSEKTREGDGTPPTPTLPAIATSPGTTRATTKPTKPTVATTTPAKPTPATAAAPKPAAPPKNAKQARLLLTKAQAAAKKKSWDPAREMYERVSRGRYSPEHGHLGLAQVALATGDAKAAQKHAKTAVRLGGGSPAKKLLAQANAKLKKKR